MQVCSPAHDAYHIISHLIRQVVAQPRNAGSSAYGLLYLYTVYLRRIRLDARSRRAQRHRAGYARGCAFLLVGSLKYRNYSDYLYNTRTYDGFKH